MELDIQSLFGLLYTAVYSLAETSQQRPPPPRIWAHIRGRYWSAKAQDRRHLFVAPYRHLFRAKMWTCFLPMRITRMKRGTTMNGIIFTMSSLKNKNSSGLRQGMRIEFPNRLKTVSVIPRKKVLIGTFEAFSLWKSQFSSLERNRTERNYGKKLVWQNRQNNLAKRFVRTAKIVFSDNIFFIFGCLVLRKWFKTKVSCFSKQNWDRVFFREMLRNKIPESLILFLFHGKEFWFVFLLGNGSEMEFREFASIFVPRYSIFIFCRMVRISYFAQRWLDFSLIKMFSVLKYIADRGHTINST